ncbi:hypothetical protein PR048_023268 [Dryococelus australis]|uniref:Integrase catalytic domain-containing protein n=1 Tax=Dryococelus australis TaxID=614101 RepID=A0ABQ9GTP9_9NEOP|nr:hypothetical protein PR048_023268 [Dryococelus australis]
MLHNFNQVTLPLPEHRVRDAAVFEVIGVVIADPLYLKDGSKAWICILTCAVSRAVHIELVIFLSTEALIQDLKKFVAHRGHLALFYSDNRTNFVEVDNAFFRWDCAKIKFSLKVESTQLLPGGKTGGNGLLEFSSRYIANS